MKRKVAVSAQGGHTWFRMHGSLLVLSVLACSAGVTKENEPTSGAEGASGGSTSGSGSHKSGGSAGDGDLSLDDAQGSGGSLDECGSDRADSEPLPLSLMILLDQSGSMTIDQPNRWDPVTAALVGFVDDDSLSGMRLGIQYFPLGASTTEDPAICLSQNYETPDVPLTDVPAASSLIVDSITAHHFTAAEGDDAPHWGTPTRPALEGTYAYLQSWARENPESTPVLVLATDGKPSKLCYDETDALDGIAEITNVITEAAMGTPPIKTYVIGIGEIERLDEWAEAGQTGESAFVVDPSNAITAEEEFRAVMNQIRAREVPCSYPIPTPVGGALDFGKVNVEFSDADDNVHSLAQVEDEGACSSSLDWFYDDQSGPTAIELCPAACAAINAAGGAIEIVFGCQTIVR